MFVVDDEKIRSRLLLLLLTGPAVPAAAADTYVVDLGGEIDEDTESCGCAPPFSCTDGGAWCFMLVVEFMKRRGDRNLFVSLVGPNVDIGSFGIQNKRRLESFEIHDKILQ